MHQVRTNSLINHRHSILSSFSGHAWGPDSEQRLEAMKELDDLLLYINDQVNGRNLSETVSKYATLKMQY